MITPLKKILALCYSTFRLIRKYDMYSLSKRVHIIFDYYKLYRKRRLLISEYYEYEFEKASKEFKESFLGMTEQGYYLKTLNPIKYYTLARNKYLAHICLEKAGIPMPTLWGYYNPYLSNAKNDFSNLLNELQDNKHTPFVIKATESSHGEGVYIVKEVINSKEKVWLSLVSKKKILLVDFLDLGDELIVESAIKQTKQFAGFNESSVNTIRFMTTLYPNGDAKIIAAFIKIGRNGAYIDNAGIGGNVDANIDVRTGKINNVIIFSGYRDVKKSDIHPDTGKQIEGVIIDNWEDIKDKVISYQKALPFVKAAGWDVAITDEGPIIIEVNDSWDRTGQLFIQRGWRREIRECFQEWNNIGYKPTVERGTNNLSLSTLNKYYQLFK